MSVRDAKSDLFETSRALDGSGPAAAIEKLTADLEEAMDAYERKAVLLVNRACLSLSLEMTNLAIKDCNDAIKSDPQCALAFFVCGIAHLWNQNEEAALSAWYQGLDNFCSVDLYFLMFVLINNANVRSWLNFRRFDVRAVLELAQDWSRLRNFTEDEHQSALDELRMQNATNAVMHFTQIIEVDAKAEAYKGRGVAHCLAGEWDEAVADLTVAIEKSSEPDESLKFRGFALSAKGQHLPAIADLSKYMRCKPDDEEGVLYRARIERMVGHYEVAMSLFLSADQAKFDDADWLAFAQTLCDFGMFEKAKEAMGQRKEATDHATLYTKFLIHKGLEEWDDAGKCISEAVEQCDRRSQFLVRCAAEFFFDNGDIEKAVEFYKDSYADKSTKEEIDVRFNHACALMTLDRLKEACDLLEQASVAYFAPDMRETWDFFGERRMLGKTSRGEDNMRAACALHQFVTSIIGAYKECITTVKLPFYPSETRRDDSEGKTEIAQPVRSLPSSFLAEHRDMLEDADRLGSRCTSRSPHMQRVLGFCILRLAVLMRQTPVRSWQSVIDEMKMLIPFGDWRNQMIDYRQDTTTPTWTPIYYIVKNSRPVRKHEWARETIYGLVKKRHPEIRDIRDLFTHPNPTVFSGSDYFLITDDEESKFVSPWISVVDQGTLGYDIMIRLRYDADSWQRYDAALSNVFAALCEKRSDDLNANIARAMLLIWMQHTLEHCNEEFALVFLHAAVLAFTQKEITGNLNDRLLLTQLIFPDYHAIESEIAKLPQSRALVKKPSVEFWKTLPTFETLFTLVTG